MFESFIAFRYLRSRRRQKFVSVTGLIAITGVIIGVMALNVVLSVMGGFEDELREKILGVSSHVVVLSYEGPIDNYKEIKNEVLQFPGVEGASPFIYGQAMLAVDGNVSGTVVRGIDPETAGDVTSIHAAIGRANTEDDRKVPDEVISRKGKELLLQLKSDTESGKPPLIIGSELASTIGVARGDTVNIVSPFGKMGPVGPMPKTKSFEVISIFDYGMIEYDSTISYVNIDDAMDFFGMEGKATGVEVKVDDIYQAKNTGDQLSEVFGFPFYTRNWEEANRSLFQALKLERLVIAIFLGFIILVAALNIVSTITMLVMEKNRDIAILRAMGAKKKAIKRIFIIDGMTIGFIGTLLGSLSGLLLCYVLKTSEIVRKLIPFDNKVYPISEFPVKIEPLYFITVAVCSLLICLIATLYPSSQASRKDPVEALRYE